MELVDMRGLKPRPLLGPGSTPGTGTFMVPYTWYRVLLKKFAKRSATYTNTINNYLIIFYQHF